MAEPVKFEFDLLDRFSSVADRMSSALDRFEEKEEKARKRTELLELEVGKLAAFGGSVDLDKLGKFLAGGAAAGIFTLGISEGVSVLTEGLGKAVEFVEELVSKAAEFTSEWIKAGAESERMQRRQELLLGKQGAEELRAYTGTVRIAGMDDGDLAKSLQPLLRVGIGGQLLKDAAAAAGDIEELSQGAIKFDSALGVFEGVFKKGKLRAADAAALGLDVSEVFGRLAEAMHTSPEEAMAAAMKGTLKPDTLLQVLYQTIGEQTEKGLGSAALDAASTVEAKLARLQNLPRQFLGKLNETAGYAGFSSFLDRILEKLDPDGPTGQRILAGLEHLGNKILGLFDGIDGTAIDDLVDTFVEMGDTLIDILPSLKALGEAFGDAARLARGLWEVTKQITEGATTLFSGGILDLGSGDIVAGMERGLRTALAERKPGKLIEAQVLTDLEIHSPSRVFERLGAQSAAGFDVGFTRDQSPLMPTLAAPSGAPARPTGDVYFTGPINIGEGTPREQVEELKQESKRQLRGGAAGFLDHELEAAGA